MAERASFDELDARADAYDEAVRGTADIDRFCSSSAWVLPAARHLPPSGSPFVATRNRVFVALAETLEGRGTSVLRPLDATWGLACPLVGGDVEDVVDLFLETSAASPTWRVALVTGLVPGSPLFGHLSRRASRACTVREGPRTRRYVADLSDGVEGFLARRTAGFRRNLRKAERRAARAGVRFEVRDTETGDERGAESTFSRILDIERRSWKGRSGVGIDREPMRSFYRDMQARLARRGSRRLTFARIDGEDVAYVLGGVLDETYRGLQFSFDERYRALSPGSLCQMHEIRRLVANGTRRYDLGTEVEYKRRWGEELFVTHSLVLYR